MIGGKLKYKEGYKFQTVDDYTVFVGITPPKALVFKWAILSENGWLTIIHDYAWNGMSGIPLNIKSSIRGVLLHDACYQMIRLGYLEPKWKDVADQVLYNCCVEDGMLKLLAKAILKAVETFGHPATTPAQEPPVLEAP